ncbi:hypothetical protein GLOIN_2v1782622 [Rhizophagus irregularis DAOM 181602=DAOM 197198]|uniref:Uncharacterized protein n=1 Tax=Rhizophagus irregularis (strain DAOM 181602 / DAOM 197198 / MUCL 43194) TaxID=747089 RepID=A0A2P4PH16_RHIID|nr:hypothetical protein GLOIN_2v1782622 [Rhizophagus irregularis DAOM 181602=DAOM 197198]POG64682.1 hypothetical protein GLOIN_2v1782622 [Rhizophagus irregularis DAOM 181602=DAOM 197198]|eukprot:XP_025171548.1 hypothetical protein GLOIN_2v1782622 [Rhizophagus irregularis DAOM 181602=DAOM 197198]
MSPAYTKQKTRHASVPAESESEWSTNEKLTGYTIVEPKTWQYIKYGTHVRQSREKTVHETTEWIQ